MEKRRFVRRVISKGKAYSYFIMGYREDGGQILVPIPNQGEDGFEAAYHRLIKERPVDDNSMRATIAAAAKVRQALNEQGKSVYFIASSSGDIKIGVAKRPKVRLRTLQTAHPEHLSLVAIVQGGETLERQYHSRFSRHHIRGEWYKGAPDIWNEIGRIRAENETSLCKPLGKLSEESR